MASAVACFREARVGNGDTSLTPSETTTRPKRSGVTPIQKEERTKARSRAFDLKDTGKKRSLYHANKASRSDHQSITATS